MFNGKPLARLFLFVALAGWSGCKSAERQYDVRTTDLSCEEANRYAYRTMSELGYDITAFEPAAPGKAGIIEAHKQTAERGDLAGRIEISCDPPKVILAPHVESGLFSDLTFARGFFLSFSALAENKERSSQAQASEPTSFAAGGLTLTIKPVPGLEAKLDFGADLQAAGILPVRIVVVNNSRRTYRLEAARFHLRPAGRPQRVEAMSIERAAKLLAAAAEEAERAGGPPAKAPGDFVSLLRAKLMTDATLPPGARAQGFLFFPAGEYSGARAIVEDVETSEAEGFMVEF